MEIFSCPPFRLTPAKHGAYFTYPQEPPSVPMFRFRWTVPRPRRPGLPGLRFPLITCGGLPPQDHLREKYTNIWLELRRLPPNSPILKYTLYLTPKEKTPLGSGSGCQGSNAGASLHRHGPPAVAGTARPAGSAQRLRLRRRPAEAEPTCRPFGPTDATVRSRGARADPPRRAHRAPRPLRLPARPGCRRAAAGVGRRVRGARADRGARGGI